jgi:nucleotide-binding universal stress UspA family protein
VHHRVQDVTTARMVGSHSAGPSKVLVGSTATSLAAHATVPVLVAGGGSSPAWRG